MLTASSTGSIGVVGLSPSENKLRERRGELACCAYFEGRLACVTSNLEAGVTGILKESSIGHDGVSGEAKLSEDGDEVTSTSPS